MAKRSYPTSKVGAAAKRGYLMSKVRGGGREELPHIKDKKQWLHFAGAAMKRYLTSKVRETQVRQ